MRIIKLIALVIILFTLTGCFDYKEVNDYAIVSAISIDKGSNKKYTIGIQIMNAKKDEESDASSIAFYKADGDTIYEGLEQILLDLPKELYLGHNEVLIIGEDLLKKENPLNYLDYFLRDSEVEKDSLVIAAKENKAYEVLKIITPLETIPSRNLKETIMMANNFKGTLSSITLDEFVASLSNEGEEPVLPSVKIVGSTKDGESIENISKSNPDAKLTLDRLAFFENGKLKGYFTNEEEQGYKILSNTANGTYINVLCDKKHYATIRIKNTNTKESLLFLNNYPLVKFKANISGRLLEYNCKADFLNNKNHINKLEKKANEKISILTKKALKRLYRENSSDVLKLGEKYNSRKRKDLKRNNIRENEVKIFASFKIVPNVKIDRIGLSIKSVKEVSAHE